jgi:hypothetical protein
MKPRLIAILLLGAVLLVAGVVLLRRESKKVSAPAPAPAPAQPTFSARVAATPKPDWAVFIQAEQPFGCWGTIIADNWVMSAAHCFKSHERVVDPDANPNRRKKMDPGFEVWLAKAVSEDEANVIGCEKAIIHSPPSSSPSGAPKNDIALIHLPLDTAAKGAVAAKLYTGPFDLNEPKWGELFVYRWSAGTGSTSATDAAEFTHVAVDRVCDVEFVCAPTTFRAINFGDSGAGLTTVTAPIEVFGVAVHFEGSVDWYTQVSHHAEWIKKVMAAYTQAPLTSCNQSNRPMNTPYR